MKILSRTLPANTRTMTSDYVSYVLGLQGWERAQNEDSYMANEEDVLYVDWVSTSPSLDANIGRTAEIETQTPAEWAELRPAQQGIEAAPGRAPPLNRALTIGTHSPHPPASRAFAR